MVLTLVITLVMMEILLMETAAPLLVLLKLAGTAVMVDPSLLTSAGL